ncbi:MAG: YraN family protein [Bacteroidota bacterium]
MAKHNEVGTHGENLAVDYFIKNGYKLIHKNWRKGHWELDLIVSKNNILHFIEVKTKTSDKYGYPEDEVTVSKFRYLTSAAEEYVYENPNWKRIQFDILSITLEPKLTFFLIEDVYL